MLEPIDLTKQESPFKRRTQSHMPVVSLHESPTPDLRLSAGAADLFQATHLQHDGVNELNYSESLDSSFEKERGGRIERLLQSLDGDFELDSELRSHGATKSLARQPDPLEARLDAFLGANKENDHVVSAKKAKLKRDPVKKTPMKRPHKLNQKPFLVAKPCFSPFGTLNVSPTFPKRKRASSHEPNFALLPGKPCLRLSSDMTIFMVELLTGSVVNATQFGTELNSTNCENIQFPANPNEVVLIPTNAEELEVAIIKGFHGRRLAARFGTNFGVYAADLAPTVYNDSKRVRWAEQLEW